MNSSSNLLTVTTRDPYWKIRLQAAAELERRRRLGLVEAQQKTFRQFVDVVNPKYVWYPAQERLASLLERVAAGDLKRLMVFMPPRHGKSELVSRLFSAYYLYRHPDRFVGINSYAAELAYTFSRASRANYTRIGQSLADDAAAVKQWETGQGGGLWAAGVGGAITGKGFHLGIIDDPLKNAEEAASETIREKQKEWYDSTFYTREEPGAAIVVIQTRWHEDDLSGYLLDKEHEEPEHWHIVHYEALKEAQPPDYPPTCTLEPDRRQPGEALVPERYDAAKLRQIERRIGSYFFGALYQQTPKPHEGNLFKRHYFQVVGAAPVGGRTIRYWDKAGTADGGAQTAGVKMLEKDGIFYVVDVVYGHWAAPEREKVIKQTAQLDGKQTHVYVEQEPGSGGLESVEATIRNLAGWVVRADKVTGDKLVRAEPLAAQAEVGNVRLVKGEWNHAYLNQITAFPHGKFKDMVDATSGAFNKLIEVQHPAGALAELDTSVYTGRQRRERLWD